MARFALRYGTFSRPGMTALGIGPGRAYVDVDAERVEVRMGWSFHAELPRASITAAALGDDVALTRGVHGWSGDWLVNGDGTGIVELRIEPPVRARAVGMPIRLHRLRISVENPSAVLAALG